MQNTISKSPINFTTLKTPIDYFKIPVDTLIKEGFTAKEHQINLGADEYLSSGTYLIPGIFNKDSSDTCVFNVMVGKGKTTLCYNLIKDYVKNDYVVIMLSPYKKLVEKDFEELNNNMQLDCFNYLDINGSNFDIKKSIAKPVQIMTVNCILQNPGEDAFEQAFVKKNYLKALLGLCSALNKKVVLFFDEIHDSVANFNTELVPNIMKWRIVVHKVFISSATYTVASLPVIKYLALLTNKKIFVYDIPRKLRTAGVAKLHLHIYSGCPYSANNIGSLIELKHLIDKYRSQGRKVNILTGTKFLAKELTNFTNVIKTNPAIDENYHVIKAVKNLGPNVITGDTTNSFDEKQNNIGTNFKTGVNISDKNGVMIILMPIMQSNFNANHIFSDGIPAITQAFARLRNGGDIHVFMGAPNVAIEQEKMLTKCQIPESIIRKLKSVPFINQNKGIDKLKTIYTARITTRKSEIDFLNESMQNTNLGFQYPSFETFVMTMGQNSLIRNEHSYGSDISSYVFWASLNNQFSNASLTTITYYTPQCLKTDVINSDFGQHYGTIMNSGDDVTLKNSGHLKGIDLIIERWGTERRSVTNYSGALEEKEKVRKVKVDGKDFTIAQLRIHVPFLKTAINVIATHKSGSTVQVEKDKYIYTNLNTITLKAYKNSPSSIVHCWKELNDCKNKFLKFLNTQLIPRKGTNQLIHQDTYKKLPPKLVEKMKSCIITLKHVDILFSSKAFSLCQSLNNLSGDKLNAALYREFAELFTNITDQRATYNGENNAYKRINGTLAKDIRTPAYNFNFMTPND